MTIVTSVVLPIAVVLFLGTIAVTLVGIVGGPIKVETPIIMTVLHMVGFLFWASDWSGGSFVTYIALLVSCVVVQIAIAVDLFEAETRRLPYWLARGLLAAAYLGFILLILSNAELG